MKSKFTYGILACAILAIGIVLVFKAKVYWSSNANLLGENEAKVKIKELMVLSEGAKYLENFYREPYEHELWGAIGASCLKKYNLQESSAFRLSCSSEILICLDDFLKTSKKPFFKKEDIELEFAPIFNHWSGVKIFEVVFPFEDNTASLELKSHHLKIQTKNKVDLDLALMSNCQESFLDERFYPVGLQPADKNLEIKFDTFGKKILLDKFQVRNGELLDWAFVTNKIQFANISKELKEDKNLFKSATNLTKNFMHDYCNDHGKQIMLSHLYDAASFIPFDLKNKEPTTFPRGNFYWTKKNTDAWVYQYSTKSNNRQNEELVNENNCKLLYAKECADKFSYDINALEPTWSGLYQVMGGSFEYVRNSLIAEDNLRVSSKYFSINSSYQRIGERGYWDGKDFQIKNFSFNGDEKLPEMVKDKSIEVAFRCFREGH